MYMTTILMMVVFGGLLLWIFDSICKMEDAEELLALYTPYVTDTVITFEYEVPSLEEFKDRMRQTMKSTRIWSQNRMARFLI